MTPYDAAMVGIVVAGMVWGAVRGITWQLASLAALGLGYLVAFPLSAQLAPSFPGEPVVARALALLACYAAVAGGVFLAAWMVRATLRRWKFEAFDRHLGMLLGGLEGALVGVVATVFVVSLAPNTRGPILSSPSGKVVVATLGAVQGGLPGEVRGVLTPFWEGPEAVAAERPGPEEPRPIDLRGALKQEGARVGRKVAEELERRVEALGNADGTTDRDLERR